jgi:molybdopterin-containing oxidoreductase family iron-sulfur binding subunit
VRRFNWFDYPHEDRLQNMALNPDVTTRSRGVMEKCSLCVQRIQEAKSAAKAKGVDLADGDIEVACAQSCPADAIVFGDMNDPESRLAKLKADPRHYTVLEELGVKPVVGYLSKVRNRTRRSGADEHA